MFCIDGYISVISNNFTDQHGPKPPLPGEVARRSRDGEVVPGRDNLSVTFGDSSPERGAFGAHSVGAEQSPAPTRCRENKEDLLAKRCSLTDPDCTFYL